MQQKLYSLLWKTPLLYWAHCLHELGVTDTQIVDDKSSGRAQIQILTLLVQASCISVHMYWVQNMRLTVPSTVQWKWIVHQGHLWLILAPHSTKMYIICPPTDTHCRKLDTGECFIMQIPQKIIFIMIFTESALGLFRF